ncbi:hypothetical protein B0H16DRAFT_1684965 [Mycena metata]|uniref:Uncharacterized protein n=1 Tax=Mycena metata TaxID=1033252 RepID=A0AAD7JXU2_9AGAR|nr:hypothetical protein B0H16DRAFT_1684965 [Mycena metata]
MYLKPGPGGGEDIFRRLFSTLRAQKFNAFPAMIERLMRVEKDVKNVFHELPNDVGKRFKFEPISFRKSSVPEIVFNPPGYTAIWQTHGLQAATATAETFWVEDNQRGLEGVERWARARRNDGGSRDILRGFKSCRVFKVLMRLERRSHGLELEYSTRSLEQTNDAATAATATDLRVDDWGERGAPRSEDVGELGSLEKQGGGSTDCARRRAWATDKEEERSKPWLDRLPDSGTRQEMNRRARMSWKPSVGPVVLRLRWCMQGW